MKRGKINIALLIIIFLSVFGILLFSHNLENSGYAMYSLPKLEEESEHTSNNIFNFEDYQELQQDYQNQGLGNLCTGEGCERFCIENSELCREYCSSHQENMNCRISSEQKQNIYESNDEKLITANPINLDQIGKISRFRSCEGHDYSGYNTNGELENLRSMKHYIYIKESLRSQANKENLKVFSPFDGTVTEIISKPNVAVGETTVKGQQIFISADKNKEWQIVFFHIDLYSDIKVGTKLKAGQPIGTAANLKKKEQSFDIAFKKFGEKEIFDSIFNHMDDDLISEYASYGVTLNNAITSKEARDNKPCIVNGERHGEETFKQENDAVALR